MQIVVNHLTRMQRGYVCVAGLTSDGRHVRPVIGGRLPRSLVSADGGPFDLGVVVDLGAVTPAGSPPECEDYRFVPAKARAVRRLADDEWWEALDDVAAESLTEIFGGELVARSRGATIDAGHGHASLGVLRPGKRLILSESPFGNNQVRLSVRDRLGHLDLSVTDLRLFSADHTEINPGAFKDASRRLMSFTKVR